MYTEGSVEVDRPIDEVFKLTIEHVADWSTIVVEDVVLDEKPIGVGTTFRTITEENGKRMEFQGVVTRHEPPHLHAVTMTGDSFDMDVAYFFESIDGGGTRVTQKADIAGKGFVKVVFFAVGWLMKKQSCNEVNKQLNGLRRFCEEQADEAAG